MCRLWRECDMNLALHAAQQTIAGAKVLSEWLGSGGAPVSPELAQERANVCLKCPENRAPNWWHLHNDAIAMAIRRMLQLKSAIGFHVNSEESLHMCRKCGCCIRLKVHCPIKHIKEHAPTDLNTYPAHCWIRKELNS